jgi:GTP-binding protein
MFLDEAKVCLVSGRGGDGLISFRREKYRPKGGPDGGDGGHGGDVILRATPRMNTLLIFSHKIHWKAKHGGRGGPNRKRGADAEDLIVPVPVGTVVKDLRTAEVLADLTRPGQQVAIARGGEGGRGNTHFKSATRQAPRIRERGGKEEEHWVKLELKLLADVGILGFPNSGKSTLLSKISAKRPKIAPYPFTTIEPNLGVVSVDEYSGFVAVDIPGLIEGAHAGRGLGDRFLKHVERTRLLVHLIDISGSEGRDPVEDYHIINRELEAFSKSLTRTPQIVAGNKADLIDAGRIAEVRGRFRAMGVEMHALSALTGQGVRELIQRCYETLQQQSSPEGETEKQPEPRSWRVFRPQAPTTDFIVEQEGEGFCVRGQAVARLSRLSLEEPDAVEYLQEQLERLGVFAELRRKGAQAGDRVVLGTQQFEYQP